MEGERKEERKRRRKIGRERRREQERGETVLCPGGKRDEALILPINDSVSVTLR